MRDDLLVLEDLRAAGYANLSSDNELTLSRIKTSLRSLVAFHAASIVYERLELQPQGKSIGDVYSAMLFENYCLENPWCVTGVRALGAVASQRSKYGVGSNYASMLERQFIERAGKIFDILGCAINDSTRLLPSRFMAE